MRGLWLIATGLLVLGCDQRKPAVSDADFRMFRASYPGMKAECLDAFRYGGVVAWRPDDPDCFDMLPPQRWSGLWETGSEWTNFCPDPAIECDWMEKRGTWLIFAKGTYPALENIGGMYRVKFIGRRTRVPGNFGHQASYDHLMVVDRMISMEKVEE